MANWSNPVLTSTYTSFVAEVKDRDVDLALQFDGTTSTNLPTGTIRWSSSANRWQKWTGAAWGELTATYALTGLTTTGGATIGGTLGSGAISSSGTVTGTALIPSGASVPANGIYLPSANTVGLATASTGRITVDAAGNVNIDSGTFYVDAVNNRVGIGTATPGQALHVVQASAQALFEGSTQGNITIQKAGTLGVSLYSDAAGKLTFYDNAGGANRLTLDASGNLGLGVVPSAWGSGYRAVGINSQGFNTYSITASSTGGITSNAFNNGTNWIYVNSQASGRYEMVGASHAWHTAPSGTAGAAITFTQAMTLDASGNLGLANTSPSSYDADFRNLVIGTSGSTGISIISGTASNGTLAFGDGTGAANYRGYIQYNHTSDSLILGTAASPRATIDNTGRLLHIGGGSAASPAVQFNGSAPSNSLVVDSTGAITTTQLFGAVTVRGTNTGSFPSTLRGGSYGFQGYNSASAFTTAAFIQGDLSTTTANAEGGDLYFYTMDPAGGSPGSGLLERLKIDSKGYMTAKVNSLAGGRVPAMQFYRLNAGLAGSNVNTAQSALGVGVTLTGSTVYAFEGLFLMTKTTGTTGHTIGTGFGGTATINNIGYNAQGTVWSTNPTTGNYGDLIGTSVTPTAVTQSQSTATAFAVIKLVGTVSINAGGTFIPQYILSSAPGGAYTMATGSCFSIWPLGASGANTSIGNWS